MINPFLADVCATPFEVADGKSVASLNQDVVERIANAVEDLSVSSQQKPLLLLTAPRAGYGKTHLLGRVAAAADHQSVAIPLVFRSDHEVTWSGVTHEAIDALRLLPGRFAGWSRLREVCTGIFASLVVRLIREGRLPCANRDQAIRVLQNDPTELFRDGTQARLIGDWLRKHFSQLRKPLCEAAASLPGAGLMDGWVDALFAHANHGTEASAQSIVQLASGSREAFELWLRLVAQWRPAVLLVDHLDGFYRQEKAGLRIATMLLDLASMDGVHVVLSLNQDVWQATFAHHLPSAIEDRLTASQFLLRGLSVNDAISMVRMRLQVQSSATAEATKFENFLNIPRFFQGRPVGSVSARAFLRHCAQQWQVFTEMLARGEEPAPAADLDEPSPDEPAGEMPSIFAIDDASFMRTAAAGLAEPEHAMVNTPFSVAAQSILPKPGSIMDGPSSPFSVAPASPPPPPTPAAPPPHPPAPQTQPNTPEALERLRDMMDRLRAQTTAQPATTQLVAPPTTAIAERLSTVLGDPSATVLSRFNTLRGELAAEAEQRPLDLQRLSNLVRLAGKRFPLVKFDELALTGMPGRTMPRWSLSNQEIVFGLADFTDRITWTALAQTAASRLSTLNDPTHPNGQAMQFKMLVLKSDRETLSWTSLLGNGVISDAMKPHIEALHLDNRSIASLYAMQQVIQEAGNGAIQATPSQVMSVLARELDFFWKRVTRPLGAS